jgi:hypothetical protein
MTHQNGLPGKHYLHPRAIFHPAPCKRKSQLHTNNKKTTSGVLFSQLMWGDKRKRSLRSACDAYLREDLSTSITLWTSFSECVCGLGRLSKVLNKRICSPDTNPHNIQMYWTNQETKVRVSCPLNSHTTKLQENLKICQTSRGNRCYNSLLVVLASHPIGVFQIHLSKMLEHVTDCSDCSEQ